MVRVMKLLIQNSARPLSFFLFFNLPLSPSKAVERTIICWNSLVWVLHVPSRSSCSKLVPCWHRVPLLSTTASSSFLCGDIMSCQWHLDKATGAGQRQKSFLFFEPKEFNPGIRTEVYAFILQRWHSLAVFLFVCFLGLHWSNNIRI